MHEPMKKITQYLNKKSLGWVIIDSLPKAKIISIMNKMGIQYKGIRMESLELQDLSYDLAEEAFIHSDVMGALVKLLNEENAGIIEEVSNISEKDVESLVFDSGSVVAPGKPGKMIWALVIDGRAPVNEYALKLTAEIEKIMGGKHKKCRQPGGSKKQINNPMRRILQLEQEIDSGKNAYKTLFRYNKHIESKNSEQHALIIDLRRQCGELAREKGILHQQAENGKKEILHLTGLIADLKNAVNAGSKARLKIDIRHLQKESAILQHDLEKERRHFEEKIGFLERQLLEARQSLKDAQGKNAELSARLEAEEERCAKLRQALDLSLAEKSLLPPKNKGRRLGIFVDNQNVYYSAKAHFGGKLNYQKLLEELVKDRHLVKAITYIVKQPEVNQENFIAMLKSSGFTVRIRDLIRRADGSAKGNWDIGIAVDVITMVDKNSLDVVALVTCDGDFVDLIKLLSAKGVRVEVVGFPLNMAMDLKAAADEYCFITEDMIRKSDAAATGSKAD